jgi:hypothetical protein
VPTLEEAVEGIFFHLSAGLSVRDFIERGQRKALNAEIQADLEYGRD